MSLEINNKLLELGFDVVEHTNAILSYWDRDLICRFANNAYKDWFGIDPEEMINKMTLEALLGSIFEKNLPYINAVLKGKVQVFERDITTSSGQIRNSIVTYCPDFENRKVNGFYVHLADITDIKTKTSAHLINEFEIDKFYLSNSETQLNEVERTLGNCLLTGFPGISKIARTHYISESKLKRDFKENLIWEFFPITEICKCN